MRCFLRICFFAIAVVLMACAAPVIYGIWSIFAWEPHFHHRQHFFHEPSSEGVFAIVMVYKELTENAVEIAVKMLSFSDAMSQAFQGENLMSKAAQKFSAGYSPATEKSNFLWTEAMIKNRDYRDWHQFWDSKSWAGFIVDVESNEVADNVAYQIQQSLQKAGQLSNDFAIHAIDLGAASAGIIYATLPTNPFMYFFTGFRFHPETKMGRVLEQHGYHTEDGTVASWSTLLVSVEEWDQHKKVLRKHLVWFVYNKARLEEELKQPRLAAKLDGMDAAGDAATNSCLLVR